ncbi:MAG: FHA domain-containing protein, partial [Candidatus Choladocola sp.]|nr:FHA domain-containing protein [Candidatus Choladocola sp.]
MHLTTIVDGVKETRELEDGSYLVGRAEACRIRLPFPDVSERHALIAVSGESAVIEDLNSANGTFVNGAAVEGPVKLDDSMVVQIGTTLMRVSGDEPQPEPEEEEAPRVEPKANGGDYDEAPGESADPMREIRRSAQEQIHRELLKRLDMKRLTVEGVDREGLEQTAREKIRDIVDEVVSRGRLPEGIDPVRLEDDVFNEAMRLGPLEELLADDSVAEIMVNGPSRVYVERHGRLELSDCQFSDDASVL